MKTIFTALLFIVATMSLMAQEQKNESIMNKDENTFLSGFIDPTFTDAGEQYGMSLTKEVLWGYIEVSGSVYPKLEPTYLDLVFSGGLAIEQGKFTLHTGPRAGVEYREGPFMMLGYQARFLFRITDNIYFGVKGWVDYRYSQDKDWLGNGDMLRENGAFVLSLKLN